MLIMAEHHFSLYFFGKFRNEAALATNDRLVKMSGKNNLPLNQISFFCENLIKLNFYEECVAH